jgi:hypothetical protein
MQQQRQTDTSRVLIHADSADREGGNHPHWRGDGDQELTRFPFGEAELDGEIDERNGISEINYRLERCLDKAPSDSSANLLVKKTGTGYRAFLRIRSQNNRCFKSFIQGSRLMEVVERVIGDVRGQIDEWKQTRRLADDSM